MRKAAMLMLLGLTAIQGLGQMPLTPLSGKVLAPDGMPVRNAQGILHLQLHLLENSTSRITLPVKTDADGLFVPQPRDWRDEGHLKWLEKQKGKQALAWVYLVFPDIGALMTRRFFWTVSEPLPTLQLRPIARLRVVLMHPLLHVPVRAPIFVTRPDDAGAQWEAEFVPAEEWLTVAGFSVKLHPGEFRQLTLPVMPTTKAPVRISVSAPPVDKNQKMEQLPNLVVGSLVGLSALVGGYGGWDGVVELDLSEPFPFIFFPLTISSGCLWSN